jgi:hypothetical protein
LLQVWALLDLIFNGFDKSFEHGAMTNRDGLWGGLQKNSRRSAVSQGLFWNFHSRCSKSSV